MLRLRILISACIGTFVYVVVSIIGGQDGFIAYSQMKEQRQRLSINTTELEHINDNLQERYLSLKQDADVIASYARKLGYVHDGEKLVKIAGMLPLQEPLYDAGTVLHAEKPSYIPESVCKILAIIFFSLSFIILSITRNSKNLHSRYRTSTQVEKETNRKESAGNSYGSGVAMNIFR